MFPTEEIENKNFVKPISNINSDSLGDLEIYRFSDLFYFGENSELKDNSLRYVANLARRTDEGSEASSKLNGFRKLNDLRVLRGVLENRMDTLLAVNEFNQVAGSWAYQLHMPNSKDKYCPHILDGRTLTLHMFSAITNEAYRRKGLAEEMSLIFVDNSFNMMNIPAVRIGASPINEKNPSIPLSFEGMSDGQNSIWNLVNVKLKSKFEENNSQYKIMSGNWIVRDL